MYGDPNLTSKCSHILEGSYRRQSFIPFIITYEIAKEYIVCWEVHKRRPFHDITIDKVVNTNK